MAIDVLQFIPAVSLGTQTVQITGKVQDGLTAGGYSAFIQAITGRAPKLIKQSDNRVSIVLDKEQAVLFQKWLDKQLLSALGPKPKTPPSLTLETGPVFTPWALKYLVPVSIGIFLLGWLSHWYTTR